MKMSARVALSLAFALVFLVPAAFAQSASGAFHAASDEGSRKVEFNAKIHPNGSASGDIKFEGPITVPSEQDVDGDGTGDPGSTTTLEMRVDVDCLKVDGSRAALSGLVRQSSVGSYVGRRVLLSVEDGGEGKNAAPDGFTWGQYRTSTATWVASDAELVVDPGVGLTWTATDFEREDDEGISSTPHAAGDCNGFPLGSYGFESLGQGTGNIQVKP